MIPVKLCKRCGQKKSVLDFSKHKRRLDGRCFYCKTCSKEYQQSRYRKSKSKVMAINKRWRLANREKSNAICRAWRKKNRLKIRAQARAWDAQNPEKRKLYQKRYYEKHPEKILEFRLKPFGITLEDYKALLKKQGGVCAGCQRPARKRSRLSVDHDHKTTVVRGLLCADCNKVLGFARDNARTLIELAKYLFSASKNGRRLIRMKGGARAIH